MHGDDEPYGSVHRVELFDQFPDKVALAGVVGVMNRSATEDVRSPAWPVISEVLRGGEAPSPLADEVVDLLDAWVADDAPRLDADNDGFYDEAGPTIMDALFEPLAAAVMRPVFGDLTEALDDIRNLGGGIEPRQQSSRCEFHRQGPSHPPREGGSGEIQSQLLRQRRSRYLQGFAVAGRRGSHPAARRRAGRRPQHLAARRIRQRFAPGLIPDTFRFTNRPTFQQVLEFVPE